MSLVANYFMITLLVSETRKREGDVILQLAPLFSFWSLARQYTCRHSPKFVDMLVSPLNVNVHVLT
jgi:hypothetical protein